MSSDDDTDPPPFGDDTTPPDDIETLTPPPARPEQLLQWHARRLPNKINELSAKINTLAAAPRDHEKRISALERQRLDKDLKAFSDRLDDTEEKVKTQDTSIQQLMAVRWKAAGAQGVISILVGILTAVLTVLITRSL